MKRNPKKSIIRERNIGGRPAWIVEAYVEGKQIRRRFRNRERAKGYAYLLEVEKLNCGVQTKPQLTRLSETQIELAERAFLELKDGGELLEAVRFYNQHHRPPQEDKALSTALEEFSGDDALLSDLRKGSVMAVALQVRGLLRLYPKALCHEITADDIAVFLDGSKKVTARTKRNKLSSFFNWALQRRYVAVNPVTGRDKAPERKIRRDKSPEILSLAQVRQLLRAAHEMSGGSLVPYVVLHLFAGLRAEEIHRLDWSMIRLETRTIRIADEVAKTSGARAVEILPVLEAWLERLIPELPPLVPRGFKKRFRAVRRAAGITNWTRDVGRHTALTFHYAHTSDKAITAAWAGNSPIVLDRHYLGVVTSAEAAEFWALTPERVLEGTVV